MLSKDAHERLITQAQRPDPVVTAEDLSALLNEYELLKGREELRRTRLKEHKARKKDYDY